MMHKCLECSNFNIVEHSDLINIGNGKTIFNTDENLFAYTCLHCNNKNILSSDILSFNYQLNIFLWQHDKKQIISKSLPQQVFKSTLLEQYWQNDVYYHKVMIDKTDKKVILEATFNFPKVEGLYIALPKDPNVRFDKLVFFEFNALDKEIIIARK